MGRSKLLRGASGAAMTGLGDWWTMVLNRPLPGLQAAHGVAVHYLSASHAQRPSHAPRAVSIVSRQAA
jgi:hypothetical protein